MKYPKVETTTNIAGVEGEKLVDATFDLIGESIEYIMDGEDIHKPTDYTKVEIDDFLNSLSSEQFKKVQEFFDTDAAKNAHTNKYKYQCKCTEGQMR